jgi:hypothetical protein
VTPTTSHPHRPSHPEEDERHPRCRVEQDVEQSLHRPPYYRAPETRIPTASLCLAVFRGGAPFTAATPSSPFRGRASTAFGSEAQARRELAEVNSTAAASRRHPPPNPRGRNTYIRRPSHHTRRGTAPEAPTPKAPPRISEPFPLRPGHRSGSAQSAAPACPELVEAPRPELVEGDFSPTGRSFEFFLEPLTK